jgi:phosphoenolpyruvate synthase/pyruvate phosphate dikinase
MAKQIGLARHVVWLDEAAATDPYTVGGKAASLSRLASRHTVAAGFVLTTAAFEQDVELGSSSVTGSDVLTLPVTLCVAVVDAYRSLAARCGLDDPAVAVRSSAVDEDGGDAWFAGEHETFLNVIGAEAVVDAIARCWRSFTAPHAIEYRRYSLSMARTRTWRLRLPDIGGQPCTGMFTAEH